MGNESHAMKQRSKTRTKGRNLKAMRWSTTRKRTTLHLHCADSTPSNQGMCAYDPKKRYCSVLGAGVRESVKYLRTRSHVIWSAQAAKRFELLLIRKRCHLGRAGTRRLLRC